MLELQQLSKGFHGDGHRRLFADVSLVVGEGEIVAIMGESGVGKSTLLNCIAGLEPADSGHILVDGKDVSALDEDAFARLRRSHYGFVFQAFHILPHLTVAQNVALPLWLLGHSEADADQEARAMLARVGLEGHADDWPRTLSGGEMQRVAIARALVHRPSLVLADEPTGNLDPERAVEVLELLLGQVRAAGASGILVTHSQTAAERCDRTLRLVRTGLVEQERAGP